jgi:hypothetical protein
VSRIDDMAAALVREAELSLIDAMVDVRDLPGELRNWLDTTPGKDLQRIAGYVKPNPRNAVAMFLAGKAHDECPDWCEGCRCFLAPPCTHCVKHAPEGFE